MRSYLVKSESGSFDLPAGHYGYGLVPAFLHTVGTYDRKTLSGMAGTYPLRVAPLSSGAEELVWGQEWRGSDQPYPALRISDAGVNRYWRVILAERPGEYWRAPEKPVTDKLLLLDNVVPPTQTPALLGQSGAYAASVGVHPAFSAFTIYVRSGSGTLTLWAATHESYFDEDLGVGGGAWVEYETIDASVEKVITRVVYAPIGRLLVQASGAMSIDLIATVTL